MSDSKKVSLGHGTSVRATPNALLVDLEEFGETWIPRSQIHDDSEVYDTEQDGDVVVTLWWAEGKGFA